ncbi:histidine kinase [Pedobacter duraquae]|uniref:Histidine kinase n=1 Tax=Pedobacter duraquae TaxID=425511 RepID=A0A4R6IHB4_9SPHI|nr:histidine kinase [Pedobacter duraquae]
MFIWSNKPNIVQLQWLVWVFIFLVLTFSLIPMDGFTQALVYALLNTSFYAAIIYANILFLYPRFYQRGRIGLYLLCVVVFLIALGAFRAWLTLEIYNQFFARHPEQMSQKAIISVVVGGLMVFLLSFAFRLVLAYFTLKKQSEELIAQNTLTEINLLKAQVQPHFLFNTLNNIYYEAYLEAPRTAALIERLAEMMRYFIDDSSAEKVSLNAEIRFIENYLELEKIRMRYPVQVLLTKDFNASLNIPPMLLMPFTENIFKHSMDKRSSENKIEISIVQQEGRLLFTTTNTLPLKPIIPAPSGLGIENLRKRLVLLYGTDFELKTLRKDNLFTATLNIPLA